MIEDETAFQARWDEEQREQLWAEFVLDCVRWGPRRMACAAAELYDVNGSSVELTEIETIVMQFQETEGWHGVFTALARAIKEDA